MSEATGGNLELSRRHRELKRPHGFGDELRSMCVAGSGAWGAIVLHRERGAPNFTPGDVELVASSSSEFAEAFQRMSLQRDLSTITTQPRHRDPGLLLLDDEDAIEMANATAAAGLDELHDDGLPIPLAVTAVARRARAIAAGHSDVAATARVRTASGQWVLARGSMLRNGTHARTAVTLTPAQAPELAELIADAYGLTARERRVTELVARLFLDHYEARRSRRGWRRRPYCQHCLRAGGRELTNSTTRGYARATGERRQAALDDLAAHIRGGSQGLGAPCRRPSARSATTTTRASFGSCRGRYAIRACVSCTRLRLAAARPAIPEADD
jgi:hypothetical protein